MATNPSQLLSLRTACAIGALAAAGAAAWIGFTDTAADQVQVDEAAGIVTCRVGDFRYEFHGVSERESLFDLRSDRRCVVNVIAQHPDDAARCRALIERKLGAAALASLRDHCATSRARLRALGYL